jgi:putative transcriptional regulator
VPDKYGMTPENWARLDAMTDEEVNSRALADPDAQPMSPERLARSRCISPAKFIRQKLAMSQEGFAAAYAIPLETLKAWERHEAEPSPVELAYLRAILRAPEAVRVAEGA